MKIETLITHSGAFHADDLFAFAVLKDLFPRAELIRTRDAEIIDTADEATIVFDVGNIYDPERNRFDHHQNGKPMRSETIPYSSFGLIWKHYGRKFLAMHNSVRPEDEELVHQKVDQSLVRDIDAIDNGTLDEDQAGAIHRMSLANMLMLFRPDFDSKTTKAMDDAFIEASRIAWVFLDRKIAKAAAGLRSDKIVREALKQKTDPRWVELPMGMNYMKSIMETEDEALYVVNPSNDEWQLNVVNVKEGSYDMRKPLPEAWSGLRNADLAKVTGVEDAIFCHAGRFFACARSREGAMKLLEQALAA